MSIIRADARHIPLADGSVQCVVTSPPYWGLRDYGTARWDGGDADCDHKRVEKCGDKQATNGGAASHPMQHAESCLRCGARRIDAQIGLEATPEAYVATMVQVFREVKRILRDDGVLFLNLGDSYAAGKQGRDDTGPEDIARRAAIYGTGNGNGQGPRNGIQRSAPPGLKPKDLCGIPWRVAFALQADGWYLRSDIIWAKPNPMPESVQDRPTRSHEYLFLLSKSERYFYDADAIREAAEYGRRDTAGQWRGGAYVNQKGAQNNSNGNGGFNSVTGKHPETGRNKRDVWTVNSEPTPEAHFATFPQRLIEPCILAGTSEKGCCAECGSPRVRVTEVSYTKEGAHAGRINKPPTARTHQPGRGPNANWQKNGEPMPVLRRLSATTGWQPSCAHDAPSVPCVVFDPFGGTSTVGLVAERFGRRWVTLELSSEYVRLAKQRTRQVGLFGAAQFQPGALSSVERATVAPNSPIGHQACFDFDDEESSRAE